jgi:hypothetical protein
MKPIRIQFCKVWASYQPRAARVAELIKQELGIQPELVEGDRGEFTVWVGDRMVAKKGWVRFPQDKKVLSAVQQALTG